MSFFSLPREIRDEIYKHMFPPNWSKDSKLTLGDFTVSFDADTSIRSIKSISSGHSQEDPMISSAHQADSSDVAKDTITPSTAEANRTKISVWKCPHGKLGILRTSKTVCSEALEVLYSNRALNTMIFDNQSVVLPPKHVTDLIKNIEIQAYNFTKLCRAPEDWRIGIVRRAPKNRRACPEVITRPRLFPTIETYPSSEALINRFGGSDLKRGVCRILLGYWYHGQATRMGLGNSNFFLEMARTLVGFKRVVIQLECRRPLSDYSENMRAGIVSALEPSLGPAVVWNIRYIRCVEFRPLDYAAKILSLSGTGLED